MTPAQTGLTGGDVQMLFIAAGLILIAALCASADAAISRTSRIRAESLLDEGRTGATRLLAVVDDPPRYLNLALLLRVAAELTAAVLVTVVFLDVFEQSRWKAVLAAAGVMVVVSYIAVGVSPRTLGRQHAESVALASAVVLHPLARVLGPLASLLIVIGNALTPGQGFKEGPFASEAELRELVDLAEQSRVIEPAERRMVHSVFELGDTIVREVMVPRTDMVFVERGKTLRQTLSLALRSGFSRIPVVGTGEDDIVGIAYLKDLAQRTYEYRDGESSERVESVMRPATFVPDSKPADELLREMQRNKIHMVVVIDEYGGTAGIVTIEDILEEIVGEIDDEYDVGRPPIQHLASGSVRVTARLPVEDLAELFDVEIEDEDVETVGGLLAKHLGRVPIPGATATIEGLTLVAESTTGRRNRVGSILVSRVDQPASQPQPSPATGRAGLSR
ncbi:MAG: hemolysin family protein [Sporichthyaceae bacterium]|nr:hemolysin family protein [Sporichthyaceae bacterium]